MYTPAQSRHARTLSPPLSTTGSSQITPTQQPKLNVVTRLAIEGKVRQDHEGASIKMYLKLSIPIDSVSPGSTVPLFPEENLKLLSAQVHPIDNNSVPYHFSSTTFPMLHNAARALNLPARSQKSYLSVLGVPTPSTSMRSSRASSSTVSSTANDSSALDERYTGHIIVSGYNIAYILPKEFPPRFGGDDSAMRVSTFSATKMRRGSIGERNNMHFMAAVDLLVPFISHPPRAPYLISIPVPRCLSNHVKLRIHPPASTGISSSMASLSSAEEDGAWELTSDPHVTRTTTRPSRSGSYADMADDESSDSSAYADGANGIIAVQGTFPSTERLRIRWAQPTRTVPKNGDGRRRVGVKEAKGEMTTLVLGKARDPSSGREGVVMRVEYKGTCKGVWFPGVATMLGMDIGLEAKGSDVVWAPGEEAKWSVTGGTGFTGFDVGPPSAPPSRQPSVEFHSDVVPNNRLEVPVMTTRHESSSSTSSLLRAPLPGDNMPDYSFEGSPTSLTPSGTLSSISSLPLTSEGRSRASSDAQVQPTLPPALPLTIHLNMNDIIPPTKNMFTFTITGTILVTSRARSNLASSGMYVGSDSESDLVPIVLPRFSVLAADTEATTAIIRNESDGATVEVYNISGDLRDAQTRRTVLQRGGMTRCGRDGGRIALRPISRLPFTNRGLAEHYEDGSRLSPRTKSPQGTPKPNRSPLPLVPANGALVRRRRHGPLMIPSVDATVTLLYSGGAKYPDGHAVRMCLHFPCDTESEWLEFGLARPSGVPDTRSNDGRQPQVKIVNITVDGIAAGFESSELKDDKNAMIDMGAPFEEKSRSDWISWIKVHVGDQGGQVVVDYIVQDSRTQNSGTDRKGKGKASEERDLSILVPTFALAVGRLEVTLEMVPDGSSLRSNLTHHLQPPRCYKVLQFCLDEFFCPRLSLVLRPDPSSFRIAHLAKSFLSLLYVIPAAFVVLLFVNLGTEFKQLKQSLNHCELFPHFDSVPEVPVPTETVFLTMTVFPPSPSPRFLEDVSVTLVQPSVPVPSIGLPPSSPASRPAGQVETNPSLISTTVSTPSPSPHPYGNSLFPIPALPSDWSFHMEFPPTARRTVDSVLGGLSTVWQAFRKIYHYPLNPP